MYLVMFDGVMGSGKTLGMSLLATYFCKKSGATLYSNYGLNGSKSFRNFEDFIDVCYQPSSIVCLDEVHSDIDSRDFNTRAVKYFSHIVFYLRKMRCTLFMSSPLFDTVESRVRRVTNIYCPVRNDKNYYYYPFYDWQSLNPLDEKRVLKSKAHDLASSIFDTSEMVEPLTYPDNRDQFLDLLRRIRTANQSYKQSLHESQPKGWRLDVTV